MLARLLNISIGQLLSPPIWDGLRDALGCAVLVELGALYADLAGPAASVSGW